jgi:hypothetical protein
MARQQHAPRTINTIVIVANAVCAIHTASGLQNINIFINMNEYMYVVENIPTRAVAVSAKRIVAAIFRSFVCRTTF